MPSVIKQIKTVASDSRKALDALKTVVNGGNGKVVKTA
jgi:hypothetical protein